MPTYSPVLILTDGELSGQLSGANSGIFIYGNNVYAVLGDFANDVTVVMQSTDGGATWTELDAAGNIASPLSTPFFDGADTLTVAYRPLGVGQPTYLRDFDLAAGTWGSDYGTSGAPVGNGFVGAVYKRPDDNSIVLIYHNSTNSLLTASVYDAGWGSPIDITANIEALPNWNAATMSISPQIRSIMDPDGRIHVFCYTSSFVISPIVWSNRVFHQALNPDNSLGTFYDFPGQDPVVSGHQDLEVFSGPVFGQPAILGDQILLPVSAYNRNAFPANFPHNYPCLYIGTGLSSTSWAALDTSVSLDPEVFTDDSIWWQEAAALYTDGTRMAAIGPAQTADPNFTNYGRLRLCQSTDTADPDQGWNGATIFDVDIDPSFGNRFSISTVRITAGQIQVSADIIDGLTEWRYWLGNWSPVSVLRNRFQKRR